MTSRKSSRIQRSREWLKEMECRTTGTWTMTSMERADTDLRVWEEVEAALEVAEATSVEEEALVVEAAEEEAIIGAHLTEALL